VGSTLVAFCLALAGCGRSGNEPPPAAARAASRCAGRALGAPAAPAIEEEIHGVVRSVDPADGRLVVLVDRPLIVNATPWQLAGTFPGGMVALRVAAYGGVRWLIRRVAPGRATRAEMARELLLRGTVAAIDVPAGEVVLDDGTPLPAGVRAHPELLRPLLPGELVTAHVHIVGDTRWASAIDPTSPDQGRRNPRRNTRRGPV
jgi:hypothetical protein